MGLLARRQSPSTFPARAHPPPPPGITRLLRKMAEATGLDTGRPPINAQMSRPRLGCRYCPPAVPINGSCGTRHGHQSAPRPYDTRPVRTNLKLPGGPSTCLTTASDTSRPARLLPATIRPATRRCCLHINQRYGIIWSSVEGLCLLKRAHPASPLAPLGRKSAVRAPFSGPVGYGLPRDGTALELQEICKR
jgi:hypothetical protein